MRSKKPTVICEDYLDLCPVVGIGADKATCLAPINWDRAGKLSNQYGDFTIALETFNQFAVRATRLLFRSDLGNDQRFIPASIHQLSILDLDRTVNLIAKVEKVGNFYLVKISAQNQDLLPTGAGGSIVVAAVSAGLIC